ncbi:alpha/beta hydrolase [Ochrobactrum sp. Q0168]|uniref:alpha/beta fold hydrolase n=1 Tax=Ochrobactrum sp. Q0168 TaxID=2793241 RepID=UPI0018EABF2F|nr:alpha/beta hydrolase [Ochrobactrum sp. Q0168]
MDHAQTASGALRTPEEKAAGSLTQVHYRTTAVEGIEIFYREAGPEDAPVILLLHGFPTSSHMFRDLIPRLAQHYRIIAPDYPGYGLSSAPQTTDFAYTFENLADVIDRFTEALGLDSYALYMQDFGGPVGLRLAVRHPERVRALIVQNANAYEEGLSPAIDAARPAWERRTAETEAALRALLTLETTRFQFLHGARDPSLVSPDAWLHAQAGLDRPGNEAIQLAYLHDYGSNPYQYPVWQEYLRQHQPPTLVAWGRNDPFFTEAGAQAYRRDVADCELHLLETGHFALEEEAPTIACLILDFLNRKLRPR